MEGTKGGGGPGVEMVGTVGVMVVLVGVGRVGGMVHLDFWH